MFGRNAEHTNRAGLAWIGFFSIAAKENGMSNKVEICGIDTASLPKLKAGEVEELLIRMQEGDPEARDHLIMGNLRLVLSVLQKYWANKGISDDLFQVGCVGLMKAIDNFDVTLKVRFSTYAVPMIIGEIRRYLRDANSMRVARSIRDTAYRALKAREQLERELDREVPLEMISERLNLPLKEVACALDAVSTPVSLYEPVYSKNGDAILLMDQISDEKNTDERWTENAALFAAMETLKEREREILYLRYFEGQTQMEVSRSVGISQAQISRLEKSALRQIKSLM